jgi:DNA polymerase-3 subunit beta
VVALTTTNLEVRITAWIGAKIEEEGTIAVPVKLLSDVVGGQPNDKINLALDARTQTLNLTYARFEANIKGIETDEFPAIPTKRGKGRARSRTPIYTANLSCGVHRTAISAHREIVIRGSKLRQVFTALLLGVGMIARRAVLRGRRGVSKAWSTGLCG